MATLSAQHQSLKKLLSGVNDEFLDAVDTVTVGQRFDVEVQEGSNESFAWAVATAQGRRKDKQDAHAVDLDLDGQGTALFGVFDGHGGGEVARYCARHLPQELAKHKAFAAGDLPAALSSTFLAMDDMMARPEARAELCALREGTARQQPEVEAARARAQASPAPEWARGSAPAGPAAAAATAAAAAGDGGVPLSAVVAVEVERAVAVMSGAETELSGVAMMTATEAEEVVAAGEGAAAAEGGSAAEAEAAVMGEDAGGEGSKLKGSMQEQDAAVPAHSVLQLKPVRAASVEARAYGRYDMQGMYRGPLAGCTAVVALVAGDQLVVASAGDSRCVLCHEGAATCLTRDHKPDDPIEVARVEAAGLFIARNRVQGSLAMTRALGDAKYKTAEDLPPEQQAVTAVPDTREVDVGALSRGDFLVLACDGLWDVISHRQACDFLIVQLTAGRSPSDACLALVQQCLSCEGPLPPTTDNITVMLACLKPAALEAATATGDVWVTA